MQKPTLYIFLLFIFYFAAVQAQNKRVIDSLTQVLSENPSNRERVDIYIQLARENRKNPDNDYLDKALALAIEISYKPGLANAYYRKGIYFQDKIKYSKARTNLFKAKDIFEELDDLDGIIRCNYAIGSAYMYESQWNVAIPYLEKAKEIEIKIERKSSLPNTLNTLAVANKSIGNYKQSMDYLFQGLRIAKETSNTSMMARLYNSIGLMYLLQEECDKALNYFSKTAELSKKNKNDVLLGVAYINHAFTYIELKEYDSVAPYLYRAKGLYEANGAKYQLVKAYSELAREAKRKEQLDSLKFYNLKLINLGKETGNNHALLTGFISLGSYYNDMAEYDKALVEATKALKLAEELNDFNNKLDASRQIYLAYKGQKRYAQALKYHERLFELNDIIRNQSNIKKLTSLGLEYEFEQKAIKDSIKSVTLLNAQRAETIKKQTTSNYLLGGLLLTTAFGFLLWRRFQVTRKQKTQLDTAYSDLNEANDGLMKLDTLKSRFFTNISHEFRTPLTVISGLTYKIEDAQTRKLIRNNANNLLLLINQILELRKLESGNLVNHYIQANVIEYLNYLCESFQSLASQKGIRLDFESDLNELVVDYDEEKMLRIVSNLISNAIKFTENDGRVVLSLTKNENTYQIEVTDTGIGISEEKISYLFDRFYQVSEKRTGDGNGTGIGLTLVKELVELMQGSIKVESTLGKGSKFTVILPITSQARLEETPQILATNLSLNEETEVNSLVKQKSKAELPNLLLVEDNKDVMEYLSICLKDHYNLILAFDGQEGIDLAIDNVPDIIISDLMMPHRDGFDLCDTLKQDVRTSHIPIILLTAKGDMDSRIKGLQRGADAYLTKPFDKRELDIQLENLLKIRKRLQERYVYSFNELEPTTNVIERKEDVFISKIKQLILDHMTEANFGVTELCRHAAMSRTQLHNKIKSLTNKSTSHFIRQVRINKAKELLLQSNLNVSEVAIEVGIENLSYFSRLFSEETGKTPNKFRNAKNLEQ